MKSLSPQEQVIIAHIFKYIELSKKLLDSLCLITETEHALDAAPDVEYIFDIYKSNQFLTYADNYEELLPKIAADTNDKVMKALGVTWSYAQTGHTITFQNKELVVAANYVNINFIDIPSFLSFLKYSVKDEVINDITENEMTLQFKILEDKQFLAHAQYRGLTGWEDAEYMLNYTHLMDIAQNK